MVCPHCDTRIYSVYTGGLINYNETEDGAFSRAFICDNCNEKLEALGFTLKYSELVHNTGDDEGEEWCCCLCGKESTELV